MPRGPVCDDEVHMNEILKKIHFEDAEKEGGRGIAREKKHEEGKVLSAYRKKKIRLHVMMSESKF